MVGIGAGPFNLSVAALLHPAKEVKHRFFEKQKQFCWHPGMLLQNTTIQNSFLKDLVSFADPISPFSFLAFLHDQKRLYSIPAVLERLTDDIEFAGDDPVVHFDFSLGYQGPGKIFVLNTAKRSHGISEPNLSINAWRATTIVNAILGYARYPSPQATSVLDLASEDIFAGAN